MIKDNSFVNFKLPFYCSICAIMIKSLTAGERRCLNGEQRNIPGIKVVFLPIVMRRNGRTTVSSDMVLRLVKVDMKGERRRGSLIQTEWRGREVK
jgi:hypothetical protein